MKLIDLVSLGQIDAVKKAITMDPSIDINEQDIDGDSALLVAAMRNDLPIMKELITYGARVAVENNYGKTPLSYAEENENAEMIQLINDKSSEESRSEFKK